MMQRRTYVGDPCPHYPDQFKTEAAHIGRLESKKRHYEKTRAERAQHRFAAEAYPLRLRLQRLLAVIRQRCRYRDRYAGRGIECRITFEHLHAAWHRDGAANMRRPSIDRIDNNGHYDPANIRFIELAENIRRGVQVRDESRRHQQVAMEG